MSDECEHDKVFGPPPPHAVHSSTITIPWICSKCLATGFDEQHVKRPYVEFDELHERRRKEGIE